MDNMAQLLQQFINAELADAAYYRELARSATNNSDYQLLLNMADNDQEQAEIFRRVYRSCTGQTYNPNAVSPANLANLAKAANLSNLVSDANVANGVLPYSYEDALRQQALNESAACFNYAQQYAAAQNAAFRRACFCAAATANMHCQQLLAILTQDNTSSPNVLSSSDVLSSSNVLSSQENR